METKTPSLYDQHIEEYVQPILMKEALRFIKQEGVDLYKALPAKITGAVVKRCFDKKCGVLASRVGVVQGIGFMLRAYTCEKHARFGSLKWAQNLTGFWKNMQELMA